MDMQYDQYGRALGVTVDNWQGATPPQRVTLQGRSCRVEPFSHQQHGAGLRAALELDVDGRDWAYLMPRPQSDADWGSWFGMMEDSRDPLFFAIVDQASGQAIGSCSYLRIDAAGGVIEIGWLRYSPLLQRSVAATEAMYLLMRQAFDWGYRRYEWKCNTLNAPSMRAAPRLGFTFEGIFRQARVNWGLNRDTAWFSLLDSEWPANRAVLEAWLDAANFDADGRQRRSLDECRRSLAAQTQQDGVRLATLADLPQLAVLFDGYRQFYGRHDDAATSHDFIRQRLLQGDTTILVYQRAGELLGFTQLCPLFSSVSAAPVWLLNDLYVAEHARRSGAGRALLQAAASVAATQGVVRLDLVTAVDNAAAQALYASMGWQRDVVFQRYQLALN
ncbi:RimJ/RimL family protein N-acetyltransferase [Vogesella indigofera]|uniref:RimJ/RimL family protein N-acetyltransferase n=1 Tax=Vogesella indigofera TaxID=45465 RepID=A0A495BKL4_VOGIN|nr:GNAT family N-acetyltransferase [Vogesella indigofera]RKQ62202.1 RimJ/RimL family protein N-acetyltransferase [Vogesella indigofera]